MENNGNSKGRSLGGKKSKSKLSLKRKLHRVTSERDDSDSSVGEPRSTSFEFLKAITGETSLNQSDDFKEDGKTSRSQRLRGNKVADELKKSLKVKKSKQKPNNSTANSSTEPGLSVSGSHGNKDKGHILDDDKNKKKAERKTQSDDDKGGDSSVTSCTVILSKLTPLASETVDIGIKTGSPSKKASQVSSIEGSSRRCPVCQKMLTDISGSQQMDQHVNICLKRHFSAAGATSEDEHLARQLQEREKEKIVEEKLTEDGFYPCQICHKDLSKMNSTRRLQHVNRCIDVYDKEVKEQQHKIQKNAAKKLIPDCPICGLPLNTKLQRESHLKRCARELKVPSAQLIEIVRLQEEEVAQRVSTEQQLDAAQSGSEAQVAKLQPKSRPKKRRKGKDLDEDTQLAIAMSASLAAQESDKQSASKSNAPVRKSKGRKKKNVEKEIPVLLVRSEAERQRMLEHRLANLVVPQKPDEDVAKTPALIHSKVVEKSRKRHAGPPTLARQSSLLWELAAQNDPEQVSTTPFYVSQLKPNIAPGETPKRKRGRPPKKAREIEVTDVGNTQVISSTLQVLMDLENEGAYASPTEASRTQTSGFLDGRKPSTSQQPIDEHERMVLDQLSNLVNSEILSDIKIQTADKHLIHAHQFLVQLRCPKLMQDLSEQSSQSVYSIDASAKVLLSVLKYVYSGVVDVDGNCALSVVQFAQKYHLPGLAIACQQILRVRTTPHKAKKTPHKTPRKDGIDKEREKRSTDDEEEEGEEDEYKVKDINELIQSLWDDSDDGSKSGSSQESGQHGDDIDEEEMEEIYEYASTQAKQSKQATSVTTEPGITMRRTSVDLGPKVCVTAVSVDTMLQAAGNKSCESDLKKKDTEGDSSSHSNRQNESDSESEKMQPVSGQYTRRGWKPLPSSKAPQKVVQSSSKESSKKVPKKYDTDTSLHKESVKDSTENEATSSQVPSSSKRIIEDDYNENDVEMEDVSGDAEEEVGRLRLGDVAPQPISHETRLSSKKTQRKAMVPKKSDGKEAQDREVCDLTPESPAVSPVPTRSSSQKKDTPHRVSKRSTDSYNRSSSPVSKKKQAQPTEGIPPPTTNIGENDAPKDDLNTSLDEDDDESDTSWIIPSTPPVKSTKQNTFVPPLKKAPQSRLSEAGSHPSIMMASTPMDARNRMSTLIGNTFLPKISPVKIVLEKMAFDPSNSPVINSKAGGPKGDFTNESDHGNIEKTKKYVEEQAASHKTKTMAAPSKVKTMTDNELNADRPVTRHRRLSEQSASGTSPSSRTTRSSSQSPVRQVERKKSTPGRLSTSAKPKRNTQNGTPKRNIAAISDTLSPKLKKHLSVTNPKDNSDSPTSERRTRRNSNALSEKGTSEQRASPILIPDAPPDVSTPVVVSDESPSPTPSPTFGISSQTPEASPSKEGEELVGKPSKRKRKQSMPMRSPDKLQLTSGDAAVRVTTPTGKQLKLNTKLKHKTKVPYKSPKARKYPSTYHPLKKKYKSFSPTSHQALMRRRTRSISKETSAVGNSSTNKDSTGISSPGSQNSPAMDADHDNGISSTDSQTSGGMCADRNSDVPKDEASISDGRNSEPGEGIADNGAEDATEHIEADNDDEDVSIIASSSTEDVQNQTNDDGNPEFEDDGMFAFHLDDGGGFDDNFHGHNISDSGSQINGGEKENESQSNIARVSPLNGNHLLSRDSEQPNSQPASKNINNNLPVETSKVLSSSINGANTNGTSRVRSPPEVRIPKTRTRDKEVWSDYTISPSRRAASNIITPVITDKVLVVKNFAPSNQYYGSQENGEVMSLTNASIVPSHRQATASPTLRDHHFSPTSSITCTSPEEATGGYFGVASDSFFQEEVIETSPIAEKFAVVNEEQEEDVFVPPTCSITNTPNIAAVRPTPIRPNIDELYHPPAPITPMPNYDDMNTPALKKETHKYGLKALPKKKARLKLKEIYQYTHQVLETSVDGDDVPDSTKDKGTSKKNNDKGTTKSKSKKTKNGSKGSSSAAPEPGSNTAGSTVRPATTTGGNAGDNESRGQTSTASSPMKQREAGGESSGDTTDAQSYNDCPEDSILDDDEMPMSQPLSKNPEEAVLRYLRGNVELYPKLLMYEPLFIKEFQKELKENGVVCSMLQLKTILDKQCITFRAEPVNRHVRKSKKKKTK